MLKLKLVGLKLQVSYTCTGGNTNLLKQLPWRLVSKRLLAGSLGSTDGKKAAGKPGQGVPQAGS